MVSAAGGPGFQTVPPAFAAWMLLAIASSESALLFASAVLEAKVAISVAARPVSPAGGVDEQG